MVSTLAFFFLLFLFGIPLLTMSSVYQGMINQCTKDIIAALDKLVGSSLDDPDTAHRSEDIRRATIGISSIVDAPEVVVPYIVRAALIYVSGSQQVSLRDLKTMSVALQHAPESETFAQHCAVPLEIRRERHLTMETLSARIHNKPVSIQLTGDRSDLKGS